MAHRDGKLRAVLDDLFGNIVGKVEDRAFSWNATPVDVYGLRVGEAGVFLDARLDLAAASLWRGRRMDPPPARTFR